MLIALHDRRPRILATALILSTCALGLQGCLAPAYEVERDELRRLVQVPPDQRGKVIRAAQQLSWSTVPTRMPGGGSGPAQPGVDPRTLSAQEQPPLAYAAPIPRPGFGWYFYVDPFDVAGQCVLAPTYRAGDVQVGVAMPLYAEVPIGGPGSAGGAWGSGGSSGGSSGGGGGSSGGVDEATALAVAAVIAAAIGLFIVAGVEASRFDGFVSVNAEHPIHIRDWRGHFRPVRLSRLSPDDLVGATGAVLRPDEGGGMALLGGAPLHRRGWTYRMAAGATTAHVDDAGDTAMGPGFHIQLGRYFNQWTGFVGSLHLGWDADAARRFYAGRYTGELQWMPVQLGRFHVGGFGNAGWTSQAATGDGRPNSLLNGVTLGTGALLELELATRLALTGRLQWSFDGVGEDRFNRPAAFSFGLGLSVY